MQAKTIIRLVAFYSLLRGIVPFFVAIGTFLNVANKGSNGANVLILVIAIIIAVLFLGNALGLARFRAWAWRSTIIISALAFIFVLLSGISSTGFRNFSALTLAMFVIDGIVVSLFWTNKAIRLALSYKRSGI